MGQELRRCLHGWKLEPSVVTAVGVWFYSAETDRYLYLLRSDPRHPGTWGLPGGKVQTGETLLQAINRECCEELGCMPTVINMVPLEMFTNASGQFSYHTFFATTDHEFSPSLNHEHWGHAWIQSGHWPRPMHPGLWNLVGFPEIQHKLQRLRQRVNYNSDSQVVVAWDHHNPEYTPRSVR